MTNTAALNLKHLLQLLSSATNHNDRQFAKLALSRLHALFVAHWYKEHRLYLTIKLKELSKHYPKDSPRYDYNLTGTPLEDLGNLLTVTRANRDFINSVLAAFSEVFSEDYNIVELGILGVGLKQFSLTLK